MENQKIPVNVFFAPYTTATTVQYGYEPQCHHKQRGFQVGSRLLGANPFLLYTCCINLIKKNNIKSPHLFAHRQKCRIPTDDRCERAIRVCRVRLASSDFALVFKVKYAYKVLLCWTKSLIRLALRRCIHIMKH